MHTQMHTDTYLQLNLADCNWPFDNILDLSDQLKQRVTIVQYVFFRLCLSMFGCSDLKLSSDSKLRVYISILGHDVHVRIPGNKQKY